MFAWPFLLRICIACVNTRPRNQMSVYKTIGPLVSFIFDLHPINLLQHTPAILKVIGMESVRICSTTSL